MRIHPFRRRSPGCGDGRTNCMDVEALWPVYRPPVASHDFHAISCKPWIGYVDRLTLPVSNRVPRTARVY